MAQAFIIRNNKPLVVLFFSLLIPTLGYWLLIDHVEGSSTFKYVWESRPNFCGRSWLLASYLSSAYLTYVVAKSLKNDSRFDPLRRYKDFRDPSDGILGLMFWFAFLGSIFSIIPESWGGSWLMKALALIISAFVWNYDKRIALVAKAHTPESPLVDEFESAVGFIDRPLTVSLFIVLLLSFVYSYAIPLHPLTRQPSDLQLSSTFVNGFSSGAVAVELWFANYLYWSLFQEETKGGAQKEVVNT